jgi:hypothetical protein
MFNLRPRENSEFEDEFDDIVPKEGVKYRFYEQIIILINFRKLDI